METLIVHTPDGDTAKAVKAVLKALGVSYEKAKTDGAVKKEKPYNTAFVAKVTQSREEAKTGKTQKVNLEDFWK